MLLFRSHSAPNEAPLNLDDVYTRQRLTMRATHPLCQGSRLTLAASAAFEADNLTIDRDGTAIREDRLRVIETSMRATWPAGRTQFSANLQLRQGLDGLGSALIAHDLASDPRRADFLVTLAQASMFQRFAAHWSWRLDTFAQHSGYVCLTASVSRSAATGCDALEVFEIAVDRDWAENSSAP